MTMPFSDFLNQIFLGNSVQSWLLAAVAVFLVLLLLPLIHAWLKRNRPIFLRKDHPVAQLLTVLIRRTSPLARLIASVYVGQKFLQFPPRVSAIFDFILVVGIWIQVAIWAAATLRFFVERRRPVDMDGDGDMDPSPGINVMVFLGQVVIWSIVVLVALANLGVNVMVDDLLRINDVEGRVEYVGVRSTRLRSINGEQIIIANGDLSKSRIHNLGRMPERRVVSRLNIQYEATPQQIAQVSQLVEEAVRATPDARFISCLLMQLGSFALEFEAIYFVAFGDRVVWQRAVDAVNRGIFERFTAAGIRMAYPVERQINT
jgi:small-conductance mechanosensitive channel